MVLISSSTYPGRADSIPVFSVVTFRQQATGSILGGLYSDTDLNGDGKVDMGDLELIVYNWLQTGSDIPGDINSDNIVNFIDFAEFATDWPVIPEPADLNGDGAVDMGDLELIVYNWLQTGPDITGDINSDDIVNFIDFAEFATGWPVIPKPADLNGDGKVDMGDLELIVYNWLQTGPDILGDINSDNIVNFIDFAEFRMYWFNSNYGTADITTYARLKAVLRNIGVGNYVYTIGPNTDEGSGGVYKFDEIINISNQN